MEQAKRLKELEQENARLIKAVPGPAIDKLILPEIARGNSKPGCHREAA